MILYKSSPNQHSTLKITNNDTVANLNDNLEIVTLNQQKTVDSEKKLDDEPKINNSFDFQTKVNYLLQRDRVENE